MPRGPVIEHARAHTHTHTLIIVLFSVRRSAPSAMVLSSARVSLRRICTARMSCRAHLAHPHAHSVLVAAHRPPFLSTPLRALLGQSLPAGAPEKTDPRRLQGSRLKRDAALVWADVAATWMKGGGGGCGVRNTPGTVLGHRAHGVVVSHPLRMRRALGSNPSVSMLSKPRDVRAHRPCGCLVQPTTPITSGARAVRCKRVLVYTGLCGAPQVSASAATRRAACA